MVESLSSLARSCYKKRSRSSLAGGVRRRPNGSEIACVLSAGRGDSAVSVKPVSGCTNRRRESAQVTPSDYIDRAEFASCHRVSPGVTGLFLHPVTRFHKQIRLLSQGVTGLAVSRVCMGESIPTLSLPYVWNYLVTPSDVVTTAKFACEVVSPGVTGCEQPGDIFGQSVETSPGCARTRRRSGDVSACGLRRGRRALAACGARDAERGQPRQYAVRVDIYGRDEG